MEVVYDPNVGQYGNSNTNLGTGSTSDPGSVSNAKKYADLSKKYSEDSKHWADVSQDAAADSQAARDQSNSILSQNLGIKTDVTNSRNAAQVAAATAETKAAESKADADRSKAEADRSKTEADRAQTIVDGLGTDIQDAKAAAVRAETAATEAEGHAAQARANSTAAGQSAINAKGSADRAEAAVGTITSEVQDAKDAATAAEASAVKSKESADNAEVSEAAAKGFRDEAASHAANANTSKLAAQTAAEGAEDSETLSRQFANTASVEAQKSKTSADASEASAVRSEAAALRAEGSAIEASDSADRAEAVESRLESVIVDVEKVAEYTSRAETAADESEASAGKAKLSEDAAKASQTSAAAEATKAANAATRAENAVAQVDLDIQQSAENAAKAEAEANKAAASASEAGVSETNSKASETVASEAATVAVQSELAAKASETASKESETAAGNSAVRANDSAIAAKASEVAAAASAAEASASVGDVSDSAAAAAASAANAAQSETNASVSATAAAASAEDVSETALAVAADAASSAASAVAAKESETAAKTSENNSKASETAAKASEDATKTSETASKTSETNAATSASEAAASASIASTEVGKIGTSVTDAQAARDAAAASATAANSSYLDSKFWASKSKDYADSVEANTVLAEGYATSAEAAKNSADSSATSASVSKEAASSSASVATHMRDETANFKDLASQAVRFALRDMGFFDASTGTFPFPDTYADAGEVLHYSSIWGCNRSGVVENIHFTVGDFLIYSAGDGTPLDGTYHKVAAEGGGGGTSGNVVLKASRDGTDAIYYDLSEMTGSQIQVSVVKLDTSNRPEVVLGIDSKEFVSPTTIVVPDKRDLKVRYLDRSTGNWVTEGLAQGGSSGASGFVPEVDNLGEYLAENFKKYAGSGVISKGLQAGDSPVVADGLWVPSPTTTSRSKGNLMTMGNTNTSSSIREKPVGTSATPAPVLNVNGFVVTMSDNYSQNEFHFPDDLDPKKVVDIQTGESQTFNSVQEALDTRSINGNSAVELSRQDMAGVEVWLEEVVDEIFPFGDISYKGWGVPVPAGTDYVNVVKANHIADPYFEKYHGQTGVYKGKCWMMSEMNPKFLSFIASDPKHNLFASYKDERVVKYYQLRYRLRSLRGAPMCAPGFVGQKDLTIAPGSPLAYLARGSRKDVMQSEFDLPTSAGIYTKESDGFMGKYPGAYKAVDRTAEGDVPSESVGHLGHCYFLPVALWHRLNKGAYHPVYNPFGSYKFTGGTSGFPWNSGVAYKARSVQDCFDHVNSVTNAQTYYGKMSGRPDGVTCHDMPSFQGAGGIVDLRMDANRVTHADAGAFLSKMLLDENTVAEEDVYSRRARGFIEMTVAAKVTGSVNEGGFVKTKISNLSLRMLPPVRTLSALRLAMCPATGTVDAVKQVVKFKGHKGSSDTMLKMVGDSMACPVISSTGDQVAIPSNFVGFMTVKTSMFVEGLTTHGDVYGNIFNMSQLFPGTKALCGRVSDKTAGWKTLGVDQPGDGDYYPVRPILRKGIMVEIDPNKGTPYGITRMDGEIDPYTRTFKTQTNNPGYKGSFTDFIIHASLAEPDPFTEFRGFKLLGTMSKFLEGGLMRSGVGTAYRGAGLTLPFSLMDNYPTAGGFVQNLSLGVVNNQTDIGIEGSFVVGNQKPTIVLNLPQNLSVLEGLDFMNITDGPNIVDIPLYATFLTELYGEEYITFYTTTVQYDTVNQKYVGTLNGEIYIDDYNHLGGIYTYNKPIGWA